MVTGSNPPPLDREAPKTGFCLLLPRSTLTLSFQSAVEHDEVVVPAASPSRDAR